jgi:hypothetical protein
MVGSGWAGSDLPGDRVQLPVVRDALERVHATVRQGDPGTDHQAPPPPLFSARIRAGKRIIPDQ